VTNPLEFIRAIHQAGVKYLLIGCQAVIAYGIPLQTMDYDLYIDGEKENTEKFLEIVAQFNLHLTCPPEEMKSRFMFRLENDLVIDVFCPQKIINQIGERIVFKEIYERREVISDPDGFAVNVPCLEDLIKLKKTNRLKDKIDLEYLKKWQEISNQRREFSD
jgi:hypothetical protein